MAESEQNHGQLMDKQVLEADKEIAARGQHYALTSTIVLGLMGFVLGLTGHDWLGGAFVVSSLVPIVAYFLGRKAVESKTKTKIDQPETEKLPEISRDKSQPDHQPPASEDAPASR